jgi:hypothetical protein
MKITGSLVLLGLLILDTPGRLNSPVLAQTIVDPNARRSAPRETPVASSTMLTAEDAQLRTADDMTSADLDLPGAAAIGPGIDSGAVAPFLSVDPALLQQLKASARTQAGVFGAQTRPGAPASMGPSGPVGPPQVVADAEGVDQISGCGGCRPPDTEGAVGPTQFVEIVNQRVVVYNRDFTPAGLNVSLNAFFGYTAQAVFDPRVIYDQVWNRWIMSAEAFKESSLGPQREFLAISQTPDATGPYFVYQININVVAPDDFWDFPQLGMDQDSILVTANVFNNPGTMFRGARTFAVAKARLYNGLGFSVRLFINLCGTLAPPIVLDQNPNTYLMCAPPESSVVTKYTMRDSSRPVGTTLMASDIPVPFYSVPTDAQQPGTFSLLDSSDSRFVNVSTQIGDSLWQVHTIGFGGAGGIATPTYYEFNTAMNTVKQTGSFFASGSSNDFNASIAVDASNTRVFVTWSSTDPSRLANLNAQVRFGGCKRDTPADPCAIDASAPAEFTSSTFYGPDSTTQSQRWGDYSAVIVDPNDADGAFLVNEYIRSRTVWGTRLANIRFGSS